LDGELRLVGKKQKLRMGSQEAEAFFKSQFEISQLSLGFVDSMALKCAVELRLADIINSHGRPISLSQIASGFNSSFNPFLCLHKYSN